MLLQRGYAGLRYQDVSRASGVPVASLRHYFPTLERLRKDALRHMVLAELDLMRRSLEGIDDPWEQLRSYITMAVDLDPQGRRDGWLLWLEYWRAAAHDPEIATDAVEVQEAWLQLVRETLRAGIDEGTFRLDQSVDDAAREFFAVVDGFGLGLVVDHPHEQALAAIASIERAVRRMLYLPA